MKALFYTIALLLIAFTANTQTFTLNTAEGDTALYYKINDSRPFAVQVETDTFGGTANGELSIYTKTAPGNYWHLQDTAIFPIVIGEDTSVAFVNYSPATTEWLFLYSQKDSDSGYVFIHIQGLRESSQGSYFSESGVIKGVSSTLLLQTKPIDITGVRVYGRDE